jgi:hypothetical protein
LLNKRFEVDADREELGPHRAHDEGVEPRQRALPLARVVVRE